MLERNMDYFGKRFPLAIDHFDLLSFSLAFAFGIFMSFLFRDEPRTIVRHPTPFNLDTVYRDGGDNCFRYEANDVACESDSGDIPIGDY